MTVLCDGCGCTFSLRQGSEHCLKCKKLSGHGLNTPEYTKISLWDHPTQQYAYPEQGESQTCGSEACIAATEGTNPPTAATSNHFAHGRFMAQKPAPGTSLTTSTLLHHEHGGGPPGEDKVMVVWAVHKSKAPKVINANLGSSAKKWAVSVALPDIKSHLVETLNLEWTRSHSALLLPWVQFLACFSLFCELSWAREEVTFHWHGGILREPNTANMTLGQFYAFYSTPSRAPIYLTMVPTQWKTMAKQGKTPTVFLELYIDSTVFTLRKNFKGVVLMTLTMTWAHACAPPLWWLEESEHELSAALQKVTTGTMVLTNISLNEISGNIRDSHFGKGAMKYACDFKSTDGQALVAKWFLPTQIYLEFRCLMVGAYFLKQFFMAAKHQGVDVYTVIEFADAWLGQEIQVTPTKASGAAKADDTHEGIYLMVG
ncbi:hypothetical protein B0H14DRAFT_3158302 [Mycena olivaceomarginata]|nr:hypothetical protein B0H14DRAFT_3158302 [Mycena olivaceomarginata]